MSTSSLIVLAFAAASFHAPSEQHIIGGSDAATCDFPSAVLVMGKSEEFGPREFFRCSAALVHPQLILTAAHCLNDGISLTSVRFGENALEAPARSVVITGCARHPTYNISSSSSDMAVCSLAEPVEDVPIVPPLMGCEAEVLQPGKTVAQVGFGASSTNPDGGSGTKRWAPMRIEDFPWTENDLVLEHIGEGTTCRGDSGGPTYVQVADGTWRVVAMLSTGHPNTTVGCEIGSVVERVDGLMPWIEEVVRTDITPCHDADGTWNPGPDCGGFPVGLLGAEEQSWEAGCGGVERSGFSEVCGAPHEPEIPETTGGEETEGEPPAETTTDTDTEDGEGGTTGVGTTDMGTTDDGQTSGGGSEDAESDGCGCSSNGSSPGAVALLFFVTAGLRRRSSSRASGRGCGSRNVGLGDGL